MNFNNPFISLALPLFLLAGCSATTSGSTLKTSVEKAMDDCVVSVTSGAVLGAILVAAVGCGPRCTYSVYKAITTV